MDYKSFLTPRAPVVLPYFGGTRLEAADRRLRVDGAALQPGWWRFAIEGRTAVPQGRCEPCDLGALPAMRGHWVDGWLVASGREVTAIALPPAEEPAPLARITARRWYSGDLVLESIDFEDEAELEARRALEELRPIAALKQVVPSLRAAFALAFGLAVARELGVRITVRELVPHVVAIADRGRDGLREILDRLAAERRAAEEAARARLAVAELVQRQKRLHEQAATARARRRSGSPRERADAALEAAGARMLNCRALASGSQLEVTFTCDGVRITALVDAETLQVYDAGFCLAGADRELTLDSLPSTVREAIDEDHLNITRH